MIAGKSIGCYATAQVRCESVCSAVCIALSPGSSPKPSWKEEYEIKGRKTLTEDSEVE